MKVERRWIRRPEMYAPLSRVRVLLAAASLLVFAVIIVIQLADVQIVSHNEFEERAQRQYRNRRVVEPNRGRILDRRGNELTVNIPNLYSVGIRPSEVRNRTDLARELGAILEIPTEELVTRMKRKKSFFWIRRKLEAQVAQQVRALRNPAVLLQRETMREYPYGRVGGQVVGFVNTDNKGLGGIELAFDEVLAGEPGWEVLQQYGRYRQIVDESYPSRKAENGGTVVLSIDVNAQAIAEEELERAVESHQAQGGTVVVTRPVTGEIIAIASVPRFDPNNFADYGFNSRQNCAVTVAYEPGSTFKVVPFSGLFEKGMLEIDEIVNCEMGQFQVADRIIRDTHSHENLTARQVLTKSSNIGTVKLVERLSERDFFTLIRDFGFGQMTGIELNGETRGLLDKPSKWSGVSQANLAIGHGIGVTALQMSMAFGAIANNGFLMKPMLILSVTNPDGQTELAEPEVRRRVIRPSTARAVRLLLADAVESGTGTNARIDGVRVSGKTGTAQKVDCANKTYYQDRFISSFIGFLPAEQPELLASVVIDDPKGDYYGGQVAAPVFRRIMERLLVTLPRQEHLLTDIDEDELGESEIEVKLVPALAALPKEDAGKLLSGMGLTPVWEGLGEVVIGQGTPPGSVVARGARVQVVLGPCAAQPGQVIVPDLEGMDLREAVATLSRLGLRARIDGSGLVTGQSPEAGRMLTVGEYCRIRAASDARVTS